MAADLKIAGFFHTESLIITEDSLVSLERESTSDRLRKLLFDRIESIVVWKTFPWARAIGAAILIGVPAVAFGIGASYSLRDRESLIGFGIIVSILLATLIIVEARYIICGKTHIRIMRNGNPKQISVISRPGKIRKFIARLCEAIDTAQQRDHERVAAEPTDAMPFAEKVVEPPTPPPIPSEST